MSTKDLKVAVVGAGGKMGMRVSDNLAKTDWTVYYCETGEAGKQRVEDAGRAVTPTDDVIGDVDVAVLAVPDVALETVTADVAPKMKEGAMVLTLDPAAAYAGLLTLREGLDYVVAHPAHPSVFLERKTTRSTPTPSAVSPHRSTAWQPCSKAARTSSPSPRRSSPRSTAR